MHLEHNISLKQQVTRAENNHNVYVYIKYKLWRNNTITNRS